MSELKRLNCFGNYDRFGGYYDADEADMVIAEKDEEIAELKAQKAQVEDDCAYWKAKAQRERHANYKRCLAMARWCDSEMNYWYDSTEMEQCKRFKFYDKWFKHWLELAEKFKPNKEEDYAE